MFQTHHNDNRAQIAAPSTTTAATPFRFHATPCADGVMLYWPLTADPQARAALQAAGVVLVGQDSQPAGPATRAIFGSIRVCSGRAAFGAFARLAAAGHAAPIHRA
jgi:hypothetical protein